jgi:hypothetical protein
MSLRTKALLKKYEADRAKKTSGDCPFCVADEIVKKEFNYWQIISNKYPYNKLAKLNDILMLKRHVGNERELTKKEALELLEIKTKYLPTSQYKVIYENLPAQQSIQGHYHIHLLVLHDKYSVMPK